ncbi:MAG: 50S ribosomal protein L3 [Dehalococcoidales bacterium]|nr:50S ribosomal protein L3 [Dehalococcoidales bacterium]
MAQGLLGKKLGMTQIFTQDGKTEAVTAIEAGPCTVLQVKTVDKEGYNAVQYGYGNAKRITSPRKGQMKDLGSFRYLREFRVEDTSAINVGDTVDISQFAEGDLVDVTGISKSKGYAGVVKRHGFRGGPKTHGQSDRWRAPGSIGATTTPGRVWKGTRMAGRLGGDRVTIRGCKVVKADAERNLLLIKGAIPGSKNGLLMIRKSLKGKK